MQEQGAGEAGQGERRQQGPSTFQATQVSSNRRRTAAGSAIVAGFPAFARRLLSGTFTTTVNRKASAYAARAANTHHRWRDLRDCQAETGVRTSAPMKLRRRRRVLDHVVDVLHDLDEDAVVTAGQ